MIDDTSEHLLLDLSENSDFMESFYDQLNEITPLVMEGFCRTGGVIEAPSILLGYVVTLDTEGLKDRLSKTLVELNLQLNQMALELKSKKNDKNFEAILHTLFDDGTLLIEKTFKSLEVLIVAYGFYHAKTHKTIIEDILKELKQNCNEHLDYFIGKIRSVLNWAEEA